MKKIIITLILMLGTVPANAAEWSSVSYGSGQVGGSSDTQLDGYKNIGTKLDKSSMKYLSSQNSLKSRNIDALNDSSFRAESLNLSGVDDGLSLR